MVSRLISDWVPGMDASQQAADTLAGEVWPTVQMIGQKLTNGAAAYQSDVRNTVAALQAALIGRTDVEADAVRRTVNKLRRKLEDTEQAIASEMYHAWQQAGIPLPTSDSVPYYLATGDAIASVLSPDSSVLGSGENGTATPVESVVPGGGDTSQYVPTLPTASQPGIVPTPPRTEPIRPPVVLPNAPPVWPEWQTPPVVSPLPGAGGSINNQQSPCPPGYMQAGTASGDYTVGGSAFSAAKWCYIGGIDAPGTGNNTGTGPPPPFQYIPNAAFVASGLPLPPKPPGNMVGNWTVVIGECPPGIPGPGSSPGGSATFGRAAPNEFNPPGQECPPLVTGGWTVDYQGPENLAESVIHTIPPWLNPLSGPTNGLVSSACVSPCHYVPPPESMTCYAIPRGWALYIDPKTGKLYASREPQEGWQEIGNIDPAPPPIPPGTPIPGVPGGGPGGQCVPIPGGQCDVDGQPICKPDVKPPVVPGFPNDQDPCERIQAALGQIKDKTPKIQDIVSVASGAASLTPGIAQYIINAITGGKSDAIVPNLINRFSKWLDGTLRELATGFECDQATLLPIIIEQAGYNFVNLFTRAIPEQLTRTLGHLSNTACQSILPSGDDADRAWLMGDIDDKQWECWHKAEGNFINPAQAVARSKRIKPDVLQVISLWRREEIDEPTLHERLKQLGMIDESERKETIKLSEQLAQFTDIIRFVVRDVWNEQTVKDARLDEGFDANYLNSERAKKSAKAIGVTDELAREFWRAHWQIPSYTMLREMIFRLRPGDVDPKLELDREGMRKALMQDDWAPGFVDRMIEISYHEINRTDFTRLYMDHVIDDEQLKKHYLSVGYKPEDADKQVAGLKVRRRINDYKTAGYPSLAVITRAYGKCEIDDSTLADTINTLSISDEQRQAAFEAAELHRTITERKMVIRSITKEFRIGLIDEGEAAKRLGESGIDQGCIPSLVRSMRSAKEKQGKYLSATQLCRMRERGIISPGEQLEALIRAGWDALNAQRIVADCMYQIGEKQRKALEKAATAAEKAVAAERKRIAKESTASQ